MNMRVSTGASFKDAANLSDFNSLTTLQGGKKSESPLPGKFGPFMYSGGSEKPNLQSFASEYDSLIDKLMKQGQEELKRMKEELSQPSSEGEQAPSPAAFNDNTSASGTQNTMKQLQALLESITKFIQQSQQSSGTSNPSSTGNSSEAQLSSALSQLKEILSAAGASATSGTTETAATGTENSGPAMPKDEKDTSVPPSSSTLFKNMDGDNRSADQIINDNPVLKNLGNQKDIKQDKLKEQFGDWTSANPDEKSRALAAKNMSYFLNGVKGLSNREGGDRGDIHNNGKIEGLTKDGDARHGTEAAIVKDVAEQGLDKMFPKDGKLTQTNDKMVNLNGTNKSGFQGVMLTLGKIFAFFPPLSNFMTGMGKSESSNFGDMLKEGFKGYGKTLLDGLKGIVEGLKRGKINPIQLALSAYKGEVTNTYVANDVKSDVKDKFKEIV
ncbi:hypothetical protein [Erwinia sp. 9145]|uniref:hypothetical protein n=1 Tax=Erwinia sp. 9145 TaxID=1500895 RepID=UPI0012E05D13|nr:hypothetical protein [Erwinia sp. 9145]